jgi:hypothetical protein
MRCISPYAGYSITVFEGNEQIVVDARGFAQSVVLEKPVIANFERSGLLDHEIELALMSFTFAGLPEGINPLTRIAVFDTEAYCSTLPADRRDELQVKIDQRLRDLAEQSPGDFIVVDAPEVEKPWSTYDECTVEEILALQLATGCNPESVYRYELENLNRDEVLEPMLRQYDPVKAAAEYGELEEQAPEFNGGEPIVVQS